MEYPNNIMLTFHPVKFIEEVKARPGLYNQDLPVDRAERLELWKQVGAALFPDWDTYSKATAYDRVLQLQKKWRSIRDAYNRELRLRRADKVEGNRLRKVYRYYKRLTFLGGLDDDAKARESEHEDDGEDDRKLLYPVHELKFKDDDDENPGGDRSPSPTLIQLKKTKKKKRKRVESTGSIQASEEYEMPMPIFSTEMTDNDCDSDRLFLMSFAPEMKQLPVHIKMWARAQIANIMQEAVSHHLNNTMPRSSTGPRYSIKRQNHEDSE